MSSARRRGVAGSRPAGALAVAAAVVLLAGCGGSSRLSKAEYEQRIQRDGRDVQAAVAGVAGSITSPARLPLQAAAAKNAVRSAADDLDKAKPPKDAEADNDAIVGGLRRLEEELGKLRAAANKHDVAGLRAAAKAMAAAPEIRAAQRAAADLKKKGYEIGAIGGT